MGELGSAVSGSTISSVDMGAGLCFVKLNGPTELREGRRLPYVMHVGDRVVTWLDMH